MKHFAFAALALAACSDDDGIDSNEEARRAYFGLDASVEKSLALGFAGFNAANSANIDPQMMPGDAAGMLTITGQVDQGSSANKGMRLRVGMVDYNDGDFVIVDEDSEVTLNITYATDADPANQPFLELKLKDIPDGTFTGSLAGRYHMTGSLEGDADLSLSFTGTLMPVGQDTVRVPGMTTVTGTATSGDGVFEVALTL